ncbi:unannotated protein [freshwater metagenome]|uniref:Unannotated protein n=1 Tax=freshwater metagenome TaxID=449393 RepID=A0A6J6V5E1_9ZZZZ
MRRAEDLRRDAQLADDAIAAGWVGVQPDLAAEIERVQHFEPGGVGEVALFDDVRGGSGHRFAALGGVEQPPALAVVERAGQARRDRRELGQRGVLVPGVPVGGQRGGLRGRESFELGRVDRRRVFLLGHRIVGRRNEIVRGGQLVGRGEPTSLIDRRHRSAAVGGLDRLAGAAHVDVEGLPRGGEALPTDAVDPPDDRHDEDPAEEAGQGDKRAEPDTHVGGDEQPDRSHQHGRADEHDHDAADGGVPRDTGERERNAHCMLLS